MVDINWNILRPVDIGGAFQQGMEQGRQRRAEAEIDKQLTAMAQNPNAPISNALMRFAPREAYELRQQQTALQKKTQIESLRQKAAAGDQQAMSQLAGVDLEGFDKLDEISRRRAKENIEVLGQIALAADTPQKWDAYVDQLGPQFAQYRGQFSQREGIIARANLIKDYLSQNEPKYMAAPQGAGLINVKDPAAIAAWNAETVQQTPQIQDGTTATNPQTGQKIILRNGQWQPMGGSVGNDAGGF